MNQHSGYPMLQIARLGENIIEFCHNESVEIGDRVHIALRKFEDTCNAEFDIAEIIEQRESKGQTRCKGRKLV